MQSAYYVLAHVKATILHALRSRGRLCVWTLRQWLPQKLGRMTHVGSLPQVMALIAYLMEHKNNYGPHLIIVPNAVMVNWKAELTAWLPSAKCVYYVGHKDDRARKFNLEVASLQFNVLVTTYEYIMRDRAKLSKV